MFRLKVKSEPAKLEILPGLVVKVRPLTTAISQAAANKAAVRAGADLARARDHKSAGGEFSDPTQDATDASVLEGLAAHYEIEALAEYGIMEWYGVGDADGQPAPVTPENVRMLVSYPGVARLFNQEYRNAFSLTLAVEGNGSGRSSGGASGGVPTAGDALPGQPDETQNTTTTAPDAPTAPAS